MIAASTKNERWLIYALGGGAGHLTRAISLARAAIKKHLGSDDSTVQMASIDALGPTTHCARITAPGPMVALGEITALGWITAA